MATVRKCESSMYGRHKIYDTHELRIQTYIKMLHIRLICLEGCINFIEKCSVCHELAITYDIELLK